MFPSQHANFRRVSHLPQDMKSTLTFCRRLTVPQWNFPGLSLGKINQTHKSPVISPIKRFASFPCSRGCSWVDLKEGASAVSVWTEEKKGLQMALLKMPSEQYRQGNCLVHILTISMCSFCKPENDMHDVNSLLIWIHCEQWLLPQRLTVRTQERREDNPSICPQREITLHTDRWDSEPLNGWQARFWNQRPPFVYFYWVL